eukprot:934378_1
MGEKSTNKMSYSRVRPFEVTSIHDGSESETDNEIENHAITLDDSSFLSTERYSLFTLCYVTGMVLSSVVSLLSFGYILDAIMELTNRWYFCGPNIVLQFLEKAIVYYTLKKIYVHRDHDLPHHGCFLRTMHDDGATKFRFWQLFVFLIE